MISHHLKLLLVGLIVAVVPIFVLADGDHDHDDDTDQVAVPELISVDAQVDKGYVEPSSVTEGLTVDLNVSPQSPITGETSVLEFFVNEKPESVPVVDLEADHGKFIHTIGVREDLNEFFHIYPEANLESPGGWSSEYIFENPGVYKIWSTVNRGGNLQSFGHKLVSVSGEGNLAQDGIEFLQNVIVDNYQVALDLHGAINAGSETEISLILSDIFGQGLELEPYLGEDMHITIIKNDLDVLIHAHPTRVSGEAGADEQSFKVVEQALAHVEENNLANVQLSFTTVFPEEGTYKMFAEFRPLDSELPPGEALIAEFYLKVSPPFAVEEEDDFVGDGHIDHTHAVIIKGPWYLDQMWWFLFTLSLFLMVLLSYGVYKYLQVKD